MATAATPSRRRARIGTRPRRDPPGPLDPGRSRSVPDRRDARDRRPAPGTGRDPRRHPFLAARTDRRPDQSDAGLGPGPTAELRETPPVRPDPTRSSAIPASTRVAEAGVASGGRARTAAASVLVAITNLLRPAREDIGALRLLVITGLLLLLAATSTARLRASLASADSGEFARQIRNQIHRQSFRLGQSALPTDEESPGYRLFQDEVDALADGVRAREQTSTFAPTLAIGLLAVGLLLSPLLSAFLLILFAVAWILTRPLAKARAGQLDSNIRESEVYRELLREDFNLLRTVRVFGMEADGRSRFGDHLDHYQAAESTRLTVQGRARPTSLLLFGSAAILALGVLGANVLRGQISLTTATILVVALLMMAWPVALWIDRRRRLARAAVAARAVETYFDRKPELQMAVNAKFLPPMSRDLRFENVRLEANDGRVLLDHFSATIEARSRVAIMGFDEEAKHALACLIPRLIDPAVGRVRIDGMNLRDVTLESLRDQVALVLEADLVFNDSVLRNIGLGDPAHTPPRIMEAAKLAHLHPMIQELPRGYEDHHRAARSSTTAGPKISDRIGQGLPPRPRDPDYRGAAPSARRRGQGPHR